MAIFLSNIPDYDSELERLGNGKDMQFGEKFVNFLHDVLSVDLPHWFSELFVYTLYALGVFFVVWLVYKFLYKEEREIYHENDNDDIDFKGFKGTAADANIKGIDIEKTLNEALSARDYALAVRMMYLLSLKTLDKQSRIKWMPHKTPLMYIRELQWGSEELKDITTMFLYIKYGHYPADEATYTESKRLYEVLISYAQKGGNS